MHMRVYQERPDVNAVVHAHPPVATAFTVAGIDLDQYILPEAVLTKAYQEAARVARRPKALRFCA